MKSFFIRIVSDFFRVSLNFNANIITSQGDVAIDNYGNLSLLGGSALEPNSVWYELTPHRNKRGVEEDLDRYEPIAKKAKN